MLPTKKMNEAFWLWAVNQFLQDAEGLVRYGEKREASPQLLSDLKSYHAVLEWHMIEKHRQRLAQLLNGTGSQSRSESSTDSLRAGRVVWDPPLPLRAPVDDTPGRGQRRQTAARGAPDQDRHFLYVPHLRVLAPPAGAKEIRSRADRYKHDIVFVRSPPTEPAATERVLL